MISHLDRPLALLTNKTDAAGHFLAVKLIGVDSQRAAIGTTVTLTVGGRPFVRQLTAGDGYHASNQRLLIFGLGAADRVQTLHIDWPSGVAQEFTNLPVDVELLFIEGRANSFLQQER